MRTSKEYIEHLRSRKKRPSKSRFGAFDIETIQSDDDKKLDKSMQVGALGGKECIITYAYEVIEKRKHGDKTKRRLELDNFFTTTQEFLEYLIETPDMWDITWYAHNMVFDTNRMNDFFETLIRDRNFKLKPLLNKLGTLIAVTLYNEEGKQIFHARDFMCIFSTTLEKVLKSLLPEEDRKLTGSIDFENGEEFDINNPQHMQYAYQDSNSLLKAAIKTEELLIERFGIPLMFTAASCAMAAWRVTIPKGVKYRKNKIEIRDYARSAYYGGFVFLGTKAAKNESTLYFHYDFSSAYPYSMRAFGVPYGKPERTTKYREGDIGQFLCEVTVSDTDLPTIPMRTKHGIIWARGTFKDVLTHIDIESAKQRGIKVEVIEGYRYERIVYPFTDIVNLCEQMRKDFKGGAVEFLAKLIQNSLYGKFGSTETQESIIYERDGDHYGGGFCDEEGDLSGLVKYKKVELIEKDDAYLMPEWAAHITACARRNLHEAIDRVGKENTLYCDTDSVIVTPRGKAKLDTTGLIRDGYGGLVLENIYTDFKAKAPKVYTSKVLNGGSYKGRAKGIGKKHQTSEFFTIMMINNVNDVQYQSISTASYKMSTKGAPLAKVSSRKLTDINNSVGWCVDETGEYITKHVDNVKDISPLLNIF
jgi:hypothetical protein